MVLSPIIRLSPAASERQHSCQLLLLWTNCGPTLTFITSFYPHFQVSLYLNSERNHPNLHFPEKNPGLGEVETLAHRFQLQFEQLLGKDTTFLS